jgi:hypothetical protein
MTDRKIIKREVSVAGHCFRAGMDALQRTEEMAPGYEGWRTANAMCAVAMWAFALEADVNHLLQRLLAENPDVRQGDDPTLKDAYWRPLKERIQLFCRWAEIDNPDFGTRPFQVVCSLKHIRDAIVHGKPYLTEQAEVRLTEEGNMPKLPKSLMADWEAERTFDRVKRYRDDVIEVHRSLVEMSGLELGNPLAITSVTSW